MTERRIDQVQISLSRGTIELPWDSREQLLEQFRHLDSLRAAREAFEAVGTSQPVSLTREDRGGLIQVIEVWASQTHGGFEGLPEGIFELRNALHDDLHDTTNE